MKLSKIKVLIYALLIIVCYSSIAWAKATTTELNNIGQLAVTSIDNGGKLLFSDSPELVDKDGIMYADTIQGIARLYCYHVNNTNSPKRIFILLENNSETYYKSCSIDQQCFLPFLGYCIEGDMLKSLSYILQQTLYRFRHSLFPVSDEGYSIHSAGTFSSTTILYFPFEMKMSR